MLPALTMGDPAGIGPELTVKAWEILRRTGDAFLWIGDPVLLGEAPFEIVGHAEQAASIFPSAIPVMPLTLPGSVTPGQADSAMAGCVIDAIETATRLAITGQVSAIVTNPISKIVLKQGGFAFPGHTEFLASLCGVEGEEIMMLASPRLRVVPVTVHVSLREALDSLTTDRIVHVGATLAEALRRDFGLMAPRIAVAGLNPHAGEGGVMGHEEQTMIAPAIEAMRQAGIDASGPYPPDTLFTDLARPLYDAALCMYHDQALIPLKTLDMASGVNVTLGLPVVRTSPDHGTAFAIAGQGKADPASLLAAMRMARDLGARRAASKEVQS
ncbi:4-hydroxythreonine-4-phosphate dehydrogenase PdxA [Asaia krungthepensis]|uniref:4-hydroxythreonine-4-phosphate dehydrogenase n=1 Tax=Asaia krungthepensis NRIC 0535 TaxID=1307925 RepID=A0ABQ0PWB6_9PROT|nr:pyridoxal phosphate biosynthetic protein PdxA [Asaia krungthepensis NRIC 0535]